MAGDRRRVWRWGSRDRFCDGWRFRRDRHDWTWRIRRFGCGGRRCPDAFVEGSIGDRRRLDGFLAGRLPGGHGRGSLRDGGGCDGFARSGCRRRCGRFGRTRGSAGRAWSDGGIGIARRRFGRGFRDGGGRRRGRWSHLGGGISGGSVFGLGIGGGDGFSGGFGGGARRCCNRGLVARRGGSFLRRCCCRTRDRIFSASWLGR